MVHTFQKPVTQYLIKVSKLKESILVIAIGEPPSH